MLICKCYYFTETSLVEEPCERMRLLTVHVEHSDVDHIRAKCYIVNYDSCSVMYSD